jgi:hypothetical protein
LGLFFIGTEELHGQMLAESFWGTFTLRFSVATGVGLICAWLWLGLNYGLLKSGVVQHINLRKTALLLMAGAIGGTLVGTLFFCLS